MWSELKLTNYNDVNRQKFIHKNGKNVKGDGIQKYNMIYKVVCAQGNQNPRIIQYYYFNPVTHLILPYKYKHNNERNES